MRVTFAAIITGTILTMGSAYAVVSQDLLDRYAEAKREYNLEAAESVLADVQAAVEGDETTEPQMTLARAALLVSELRRLNYENWDSDGEGRVSARRQLGRSIDDSAKVGLGALEKTPDSSERSRIEADLLGTMIRTKFKGRKYGDRMKLAMGMAVQLDPENVEAWVTGCKIMLFAPERHGGNVPEALTMLDRALSLQPEHERALIFRGVAYQKLDDKEAATMDWSRAMENNPYSEVRIDHLKTFQFELDDEETTAGSGKAIEPAE